MEALSALFCEGNALATVGPLDSSHKGLVMRSFDISITITVHRRGVDTIAPVPAKLLLRICIHLYINQRQTVNI